jgi:hypothetical protein
MAAKFKILVGADLDAAVKSINDFVKTTKNGFANVDGAIIASTNEFKRLQSLLSKTEDPRAISVYQKRLQSLASQLSTQIPPAAAKSAAAINTVQNSSNRASFAVLNLGRIAQDSAFGFIGIANNIEPFVQSLTALKRESGSTKTAVKSFFSSLAGPGAIGLIIGAISLLDAYSKGYGVFAGRAKKAKEEQDDLTESINDFGKTIADSAGKEIAGLNSLLNSINNVNLSQKQRLFFVDELQKQYPAYFGNLTKEQILAGETGDAYKRLTVDILAAAKARAAQDVLSKIASEQLANEERELKRLTQVQKDLRNATSDARIASGGTGGVGGNFGLSAEEKRNGITAKSIKLTAEFNARQKELNTQAQFYVKFVNDGAAATANLGQKQDSSVKATVEKAKATKELTAAEKELKAATVQNIALRNADLTVQKATTEEIERANAALKERNRLQALSPLGAGLGPQAIGGNIAAKAVGDILNAKQLADELRDADAAAFKLSENATFAADQLTTLFNASFQAISQGQSPIEAITNSLKGLIVRLAAAAAAAALLSALLPGNTAIGGIVAGGGKGFGALFGSLLGLASGGIATRPMPALIGDGGPEAVIPLSQLANIIGGVAMQMGGGSGGGLSIVRGQDIYYSNNNASRSFGRLFG